MTRYDGLTAYLLERREPVVELSFAQLDALVDGGLPPSARRYPAWWANSRHSQPQARYWLDAGRQAVPDFNGGRVRFPFASERRIGPRRSVQQVARRSKAPEGKAEPIYENEAVSPNLQVEWSRLGQVTVESDRPMIPVAPPTPGVYRFTLVVAGPDTTVYVGESDNLHRRMVGYRNPGATQATNRRIHSRICDTVHSGGTVELSVVAKALLEGDLLDLARRPARLLVENALLLHLDRQGVKVENL